MRALIVLVAILIVTLTACGGGSSGSSKSSYEKANTDLVNSLPQYPHMTLKTQATTGYTTGKGIAGYQTRYIYDLPPAATLSSVQAFYLKQMHDAGWQQVASLTGPVVNYRKGDAFVSVNMAEVKQHKLELLADHAFFSHVKK